MALKATVCKATLQIADIDRGLYADHSLTIARQPSENDERMMIRILAFALHVPADSRDGGLELAKGMQDPDEPELWQKDLTGRIVQWIEVGQPEERRLVKASGRAERVCVYAFGHSAPTWWAGLRNRVGRARNIEAWQVLSEQSRELAGLAARTMHLQMNRQDGLVWMSDGERSVQVAPVRLE
ncbi:MAG: YaeQ family protein [Pseudomonadota bacterium]|nr:YaeQ family protein [Pseudomonadota bacterium]